MNPEAKSTKRGSYKTPVTGSYAATLCWWMPAKDRKERRSALVGMRLAVRHVYVGWTDGRRDEVANKRHPLWKTM